jgi:hypothetical protein
MDHGRAPCRNRTPDATPKINSINTESAQHLREVLSDRGGRIAWWSGCRRDRQCVALLRAFLLPQIKMELYEQ